MKNFTRFLFVLAIACAGLQSTAKAEDCTIENHKNSNWDCDQKYIEPILSDSPEDFNKTVNALWYNPASFITTIRKETRYGLTAFDFDAQRLSEYFEFLEFIGKSGEGKEYNPTPYTVNVQCKSIVNDSRYRFNVFETSYGDGGLSTPKT